MKEHPFHNKKDHAVHIGGKVIHPGETRMVDASLLHSAHEKEQSASSVDVQLQDPLLDILDGNVGQVAAALDGLSAEELDALELAEKAGNTRKGVMQAIAEARLTLASDQSGENTNSDDGDAAEGSDADGPALKVVQESGES